MSGLYRRCPRCEKATPLAPYFARPDLDDRYHARAAIKNRPCLNCGRPIDWPGEFMTPCPCGAHYGPHSHLPPFFRLRARVRAWFINRALDLGWKP